MVSEWRTTTIGTIADIIGGSTPSTKDPNNFGGDIPWLTPKDLSGPHNRFMARGSRNLTEQGLISCSAKLVPSGTVLLTTRAPIGYVAIAANDIATNQGLRNLVLGDGDCSEFLYYWLKCNIAELERYASGSTFQELSGSSLKRITIQLPPLPKQRAIAHILGTLDDKIELNRHMNETLEEMARALFKSWFLDFDPVRTKMEGRDPSLPKHIADLFPDQLDDDGKPEGWVSTTISDVCKLVKRGITPEYQAGSGCYIVNQRVNRGSQLDWTALKELSPSLDVPTDCFAKRWDVLVNCLGEGTLGRVHLFTDTSDLYVIDQHISICRASNPSTTVYIYQVLASPSGQEKIESLKTGSTGMTMFNISKLRSFDFQWPGARLVDEYFKIVQNLWMCRTSNDEQSQILTQIRDFFLPKLISGEICIADAEKLTAEVT